jgi:hypothetical protein
VSEEEWLAECARHAWESDNHPGGAPLTWYANAAAKRKSAIEEFGQAAFDTAYQAYGERHLHALPTPPAATERLEDAR